MASALTATTATADEFRRVKNLSLKQMKNVSNLDAYPLVLDNRLVKNSNDIIEIIENLSDRYIFYLRPRRFGKSLFLSLLHHYYSLAHKNDFQKLFGDTYIGQQPTPKANSYLILHFNFSGLNTEDKDRTFSDFLEKVNKD